MFNKRCAAVMCAAAITMMGGSPAAFADDRVATGANSQCAPVNDIDFSKLSNLQVRKTAPNKFDAVEPGQLPFGPVSGMVFRLQRVNADFSTVEARKKASQLTVEEAKALGLGEAVEAETNSSGIAFFKGLKPGIYLLTETVPEDGKYNYRQSRPMLVMLPLVGDPKSCEFTYDSVIVTKPEPQTPPPTIPPTVPPTTPPTKPPTVPPGTPTPSTTPTTPVPPGEEVPPSKRIWLPETGASVLGILALGLVLIGVGVTVLRKPNRAQQDTESQRS